MKKIISVIFAASLFLTGCAGIESSENVITDQASTASKEVSTIAEWESKTAELLDSEISTSYDNKKILRVYVNFTNNTEEGLYLYESFAVQAYQDDIAMNDKTDINDVDADTIRAIKNGKSLKCSYAFELESEKPVEIELRSPTADSILLAKKVYEIN